MDTEQHSEDLFQDSEPTEVEKSPKVVELKETAEQEENTEEPSPVLGEGQETPDVFWAVAPETESFEETLRLETNDETPDLSALTETPDIVDEEVPEEEVEDEEEADPEMDIDTPDLDLEGDEDVVAESEETPTLKPMELRQADFSSGPKTVTREKKSVHEQKLINLPLGRVKNIMKLDPDVRLMSAESIFVIAKATELFIESLTKECFVHKDAKKKTIQKRDFDQVLASVDSLAFLEGAMDF